MIVQVQASACHLAITPEGYSRGQSKVLTEKSKSKLLGPCSGTAWAGQTGTQTQGVSESAAVAAGRDRLA